MEQRNSSLQADDWMRQIFMSRAAADGGIVRRKTCDIEQIVGRERFRDELERRGFRAMENAGQTIIICNREPVIRFR